LNRIKRSQSQHYYLCVLQYLISDSGYVTQGKISSERGMKRKRKKKAGRDRREEGEEISKGFTQRLNIGVK
jgi:hypothetical protein